MYFTFLFPTTYQLIANNLLYSHLYLLSFSSLSRNSWFFLQKQCNNNLFSLPTVHSFSYVATNTYFESSKINFSMKSQRLLPF